MSCSLNRNLNSSDLHKKLLNNKNKYFNIKESRQIISVFEQNVFVWHDAGSYILTSKITAEETNDCKVITLSNPPVFDVECLLFNQTGSLLALSGRNGVMIFEVPWRYGKFTTLGSDRQALIGRSWNIAEQFFASSNRTSVIQIAWHPESQSSTHLTVLSSDNYIRIYNVLDPQTPQQVVSLHPSSKSSYLSSESKITFTTCYGENAVSFDFGPPEQISVLQSTSSRMVKEFEEVTVWPIYLLHGNGDVFILKSPLKKDRHQPSTKILGPLPMFPPSEDNYGYDSCSILCLHTVPISIVIATVNGVVYHSIMLGNITQNEPDQRDTDSSFTENNAGLYVFESVELPLTLTEETEGSLSHPMKLYKDITSQNKYHCSHVSGIHSVALPFLQAIGKYLEHDAEIAKFLTEELKQPSVVEHILCTKPLSEMSSIPVLGFDVSVSNTGVVMVCLLASWEFVCLPLITSCFSSVPLLLSTDGMIPSESETSFTGFKDQIEKVLQRSVCCPYLKSNFLEGYDEGVSQKGLDILCTITQRFREDYVQKLETAHALLRSRVKILTHQKEFQMDDISKNKNEREALKLGAERLAEKYDNASTNQQKILKRLEITLQKFQHNLPYLSKAELNMKQTLLSYEEKLQLFEASLSQIKKKLKHQNERINKVDDNAKSAPDVNLSEIQIKHVKELLMQEGESISDLKERLKTLKI